MLRSVAAALAWVALAGAAHAKQIIVETPGPCHKVASARGDAVYIETEGEPCVHRLNKILAEVDDAVSSVSVYVNGRLWKTQEAVTQDEISKTLDVVERARREKPPVVNAAPEALRQGEEAAKESIEATKTEEYRAKVDQTKKEVLGALQDAYGEFYADAAGGNKEVRSKEVVGALSDDERMYFFVSSSMPVDSLRAYMSDLAKLPNSRVSVVFRGFIGGAKTVKPTIGFIGRLLSVDPECVPEKEQCRTLGVNVIIDPLLFRRYKVNSVPLLVYAKGVESTDAERSDGDSGIASVKSWTGIAGDASLAYLVERLREASGAKSLGRFAEVLSGRANGK